MATKETTKQETKVMTPSDLSAELKVDAKRIRAFLRSEFTREPDQKNTSWQLTKAQVDAVRERFTPKDDSDES